MDRHIARTIVRNSAVDARVIWSIFSGYHPQELRESGGRQQSFRHVDLLAGARPASLWCGTQSKMAESDIGVLPTD